MYKGNSVKNRFFTQRFLWFSLLCSSDFASQNQPQFPNKEAFADAKAMVINMNYKDTLLDHFQAINGKRLTDLHLACEMMMFSFEEFALHAQCLTRIICEDDILVTTLDYQNWDGEDDKNNDEWYFVKQYKEGIIGGVVTSVNVSSLYDVIIVLNNGIRIELINKNGYHHFDDECEQWRFFKVEDYSHPHITVYSKTVDIAVNW